MNTTIETNKDIALEFAREVAKLGVEVYLAGNGTHGYLTDGKRVVSFQADRYVVSTSGNYLPSKQSGTGWRISDNASPKGAVASLTMPAPRWANVNPVYTTPEQYRNMYQASSRFAKVEATA